MSPQDDALRPRNLTRIRPPHDEERRPAPPKHDPHSSCAVSPDRAPPSAGVSLDAFVARGGNPLLASAAPLLSLGAHLHGTKLHDDIDALHRKVLDAIGTFERQARSAGANSDDVELAKYALCTYIDTAVYRTPWGADSDWSARPVLGCFFGEAVGGKKFFQVLERTATQPPRYIDLLELMYVCLALGYEGMHRREREKLIEVQDRLIRIIRRQRGTVPTELSPHWLGIQDTRQRVWNLAPWWMIALAALVVLIGLWTGLRLQLWSDAAPLARRFVQNGMSISYALPDTADPRRLRLLLADEERAGQVTIEELGRRTRITVAALDLFASGSAAPNPAYAGLLERIAQAANQVPGRITVVGHTDDQPVRSLRYGDNFELSRARAHAIAQLLQRELAHPDSIEWTGMGASEPRFDDRARNRRVEIMHTPSGGAP